MHPCVFIIFSLLLACLQNTTANQLVAVEERDDNSVLSNKCLDKERDALLQFKANLQDPDGSLSTWRPEDDDCCTWEGVTCDNQTGHHVTELDISLFSLEGEISHSLVNLSYMNHLDLSGNSFHGTIPTFIGSMILLSYLDLGQNNLNGTIPTFIGSMTLLRHLDLGHNNLNGTIPNFIGSLTLLRFLDLRYNNLNGAIPKSIGSLTQLRHLDLSHNSLYGTIPPQFGNLTNLQELFLALVGRCRVENIEWLSHLSHLEVLEMDEISLAKANHWVNVISSLRKLSYIRLEGCELSQVMYPYSSSFLNSSSSIESLFLGNNNLTSSMYRWLFPLTSNKLRFLYLYGNMLDRIPKYIGNLCSLERLYFYNNSAAVKFPDFLNNLSGCTLLTFQDLSIRRSQFTGSLPDDIQNFSSLSYLDLEDNQINGTISKNLWELPWLEKIDVSQNHFSGAISENIGKSKALYINLSKNPLQGVRSIDHMSKLSYVEHIDLSSCKLGPHFPKWIQKLERLTRLDISNTRISDTVPPEFWNMQLLFLNLSSNNISGEVPDLSASFFGTQMIDLSSNSFNGPIPHLPSSLTSLNLSRNKFSGGISFLCQIVDGLLEFLDISHNSLTGQLPDCLWHFNQLKVLNLGDNSLFGKLPISVGSLINLEVLYLYKNNFSGQLPLSLKNCTKLNFFDLGTNRFFGNVPVWIGENLSALYVLILRSNNFYGTIPLQLCKLPNLQILDFSRNNLHGSIPSCLNNLTRMAQEGFLAPPNVHPYTSTFGSFSNFILPYPTEEEYVDHAMIEWQGDEREFTRNLGLLKSIDLSSNNLTGHIPYELTNLHELLALNLSRNALLGEIPQQVGEMKKLLALDLSRNSLSGGIPSSMSQMTSLCYLNISSNNLSGRIPTSTQLQSFQPSSYDGNAGLCGPPLSRKCPGDEDLQVSKSDGDEEDTEELWGWFYIGGATGFATGFWIACGTLLLNRHGRRAFFHFYDSFRDWVYLEVVLFIAKLRRIACM
ncbi:receptor-like protein EIX2 [Lactuca sativa]|uniref:receptor-like protein EIX2 n=1 Tax=Lactuca sativa TaxID=4236 RepID=UPI000CD86B2A|nr:receptor-like protein EIX2 [Lactuca sativa]